MACWEGSARVTFRTCRVRPSARPEGGGDALLPFEDSAKGGPTGALTGLAQAPANHLDELIGDDGDEQMAFGADGLVVIDGAQAEFGFQGAEHGLDVGEGEVGAPQGGFVPIGLIGAQAVHAGVGQHGAGERAAGEAHGGGALAGLVGVECDVVVLGDAAACLLSRPMRCQTWSVRLWVRGLDSPSESRVRAASKRWAKRSTMARSLAARASEKQYSRASWPSSLRTLCRCTR